MKVGLIGYSGQKFDQEKALEHISEAFNIVEDLFGDDGHMLVSGLTDIGIPWLGYREADMRGWCLVGVACAKAKDYPCYHVHKEIIIGDNWGDESTTFINMLDVIIRVGGGKQSQQEIEMARSLGIMTIEYELESIS